MFSPNSPDEWAGSVRTKNIIRSFFDTWWADTIRSKALLLYGRPGQGKTSCVQAFVPDSHIIRINVSFDGGLKAVNNIHELAQYPMDEDNKNRVLLLDEIEGFTPKSLETMRRVFVSTKVPVIMTCNYDSTKIDELVNKYNWNKPEDGINLCEYHEIEYPTDYVADLLAKVCVKHNFNAPEYILNGIAEKCVSVRSAIITLERYIAMDGKLKKIVPMDVQGSELEQVKGIMTGNVPNKVSIDPLRFVDFGFSNMVSAEDVGNLYTLSILQRQARLAGIPKMLMEQLRSRSDDIREPKRRVIYDGMFKARTKKMKKEPKQKAPKKKRKLNIRKPTKTVNKSIDDIWS